ncbi:MAG: glycosyltransferase, partial [Nanoarchaeota archaeon]
YFEGIDSMFNIGEHLVTYRTMDELKIKIDYYLTNDSERQQIAKAGHEHVLNVHTWTHRIAELKTMLNGK